MAHYYTNQPESKSHEQKHVIHIGNQTLSVWTDHGVFSKTGLDFGSRVLIETLLTEPLVEGDILDVGCGYGPIGIFLAKMTNRQTLMVDVNQRAVDLANKNCRENNVPHAQAMISDIYKDVTQKDFALVVSNPPIRAGKHVVHGIIEQSIQHLQTGGKCVIVIQKKQGAPSAQKKMEEIFGNVARLTQEKGYWILASEKTE